MKLKLNLKNKNAPKVGVEVFELLSILDAIIVTDDLMILKEEKAKEKFLEVLLGVPEHVDIEDEYDAINKIVVISDSDDKNVLEMGVDEIYNGTFDFFVEDEIYDYEEIYDYFDAQIKNSLAYGDYLSLTNFSDKMDFMFEWLGIDINRPQKGQKYHLAEFIDEIRVYRDSIIEED